MDLADDYQGSTDEQHGSEHAVTGLPDPRIVRQIHAALGDARSVVNVGAGTGAYEPLDRWVVPIEPHQRIIAQRAPELAPAIRGYAESLPLPSDSVDAALACMTLHHWADWRIGVQELRRVARKRVVLFTYDSFASQSFWLFRDYLPRLGHLDRARFPSVNEQSAAMGEEVDVEAVPVPYDCDEGFLQSFWRRPTAYLDEQVRAGMSTFHLPGAALLLDGLRGLAEDLDTGRWEERNQEILERDDLDLGYRLLVTEL